MSEPASLPSDDVNADSQQSAQQSKQKKKKKSKLSNEEMLAAVPAKVFSAKLNKKKVKVTIDGLGVHIVEDSKAGTDIGSYRYKKLVAWGAAGSKNNEFHLSPSKGDPLVLSTKEAPQLEMAVQSATMTIMAALALATEQDTDGDDEQSDGTNHVAATDSVASGLPQPGDAEVANPVDFASDEDFASDDNDQDTPLQVQVDFSSSGDDDPAD
eukprot:COSAG02_NODE_12947_length_1468_cov_1.909423_2_plen_212_part_00